MKTGNQILLEKLNKAFAKNDTEFISEQVTHDITWNIIGDRVVEGKEAFKNVLKEMQQDKPLDLTIHNIITHGKSAAVNGVMTAAEGKSYGFCDVYTFNGFKNPKIKQMTSYAIEIKK